MQADTSSAIILFGHGARDPQWAQPLHRVRDILRTRLPAVPIELAFLEHMHPDLTEAVDALARQGAERITLVPLFIAQGAHLRHDLPGMIRKACSANPGVLVRTAPAIGEVEPLLAAIAEWVVQEEARTRRADLGNPMA